MGSDAYPCFKIKKGRPSAVCIDPRIADCGFQAAVLKGNHERKGHCGKMIADRLGISV